MTNCCITTLVKLETRTSCGNPLQRQKKLDLVDLVSKASKERRHDPDKEHFVHQKPPYLDKEHFSSQILTPKPLNQNRNTKTLRKDPAEQRCISAAAHQNQTLRKDPVEPGGNIATAHMNPDKWKTHLKNQNQNKKDNPSSNEPIKRKALLIQTNPNPIQTKTYQPRCQ